MITAPTRTIRSGGRARAIAVFVPVMLMAAAPAVAQAIDFETMLKWTAAQVIHYKIVGEYSGEVPIMGQGGGGLMAKVTDRFEVEFDLQNNVNKLLGTPVIRNFPTKSEVVYDKRNKPCPAPRVDGAFEFSTVTAITAGGVGLTYSFRRDFVGGVVPSMALECGSSNFVAMSETLSMKVVGVGVGIAMATLQPGKSNGEMTMTSDGKSLVMKGPNSEHIGWVWTVTPTIVK